MTNLAPNVAEVKTLLEKEIFELFVKSGEVVEVRIPQAHGKSNAWEGWSKGTISGYFDDHQAFCKAVQAADKTKHNGIYFTLQRIDPRLIGRAFNRLKPTRVTTSDNNVTVYHWLPVDLDPVRPSGISSSDKELAAAMELREIVASWIVSNLNFPRPIKGMSGNGGHLLFKLPDMPSNDETTFFIKNTLNGLAEHFDNNVVTIDTTVFNPARIWKLYGTTARKGDPVPASRYREARPYRMAYIDDIGDN